MASQGAIVAAVISAVGALAATVLAVVLPKVLDNPSTETGSIGPTVVTTTQSPIGNTGTRPPRTTTTTTTTITVPPVEPRLSSDPKSARVGATVVVTGTGFAGNENVDVRFGTRLATTKQTDASGGFAVSVRVPEFFSGSVKSTSVDIIATGKTSIKSVKAAFSISPSVPG